MLLKSKVILLYVINVKDSRGGLKDMNIFAILTSVFLFVSCTIDPPLLFIKDGVTTDNAILFIEQLRDSNINQEMFQNHIKQLDANASNDFDWTRYWNTIKQNKLYQRLNKNELRTLFQLSRLSCNSKNWQAFADLLLEIAKSGKDHLHFRQHLTGPQKNCAVFLPNETLKNIVSFLSKKRDKSESSVLAKAKSKDSRLNSKTASSRRPNVQAIYPYTQELYGVLADEWSLKKHGRAWGNILSAVKRNFFSDIRWIFYNEKKFSDLKTAVEMEKDIYHSFTDLHQDILLMYPDKNMKNKIDMVSYDRHFKEKGSLNWEKLWIQLSKLYPSLPNNNNNPYLLSFYEYSCEKSALSAYVDLIKAWDVSTEYRAAAEKECERIIRVTQQITQYVDTSTLPEDGSLPLNMKDLNDILAGSRANRSLKDLSKLLNFYERFKLSYSITNWSQLLEEQFSLENWLFFMSSLRANYDTSVIRRVMEMHHYIYKGYIPFLSADILNIVINENILLSNLTKQYGYEEAWFIHPMFVRRFWKTAQENVSVVLAESSRWKNLLEYGAQSCRQTYLNKLFEFFYDNNQEQLFLDHFNFDSCPDFFMGIELKEKFVDSSVAKVRQPGDKDSKLYWDLIRAFSLYASSEEGQNKETVFKMNAVEWKQVFNRVIAGLNNQKYTHYSGFLKTVMDSVKQVYPRAVDSAVCQQLLKPANNFKITANYDPEMLMYLLNQVDYSYADEENSYCSDYIDDKLNMLIFVLSDSLFSAVDQHTKPVDYVLNIWSQAVRIMNLMEGIYNLGFATLVSQKWLGSWLISEPDTDQGLMSHRAFQFYFSNTILLYLQKKLPLQEALNIIDAHILKVSSSRDYQKLYESMLRKNIQDFSSHEQKLKTLRQKLNLDAGT